MKTVGVRFEYDLTSSIAMFGMTYHLGMVSGAVGRYECSYSSLIAECMNLIDFQLPTKRDFPILFPVDIEGILRKLEKKYGKDITLSEFPGVVSFNLS